jgi:ketosteroid isomerase-like protein
MSSENAAIVTINQALTAAYVAGDAAAIARLLTEDVIVSPIDYQDLVGRAEVQSLLSAFLSSMAVARYDFTSVELEVYGSRAFERGTYIWSAGPRGESAATDIGRYWMVKVKSDDGLWRVHRLIENRDRIRTEDIR